MAAADTTIATAATAARGKAAVTASNSRAAAVGADRSGAGQRQDGAAPREPAGRDHRATRGTAMPGHGVGCGGHPHRGEHDETHEHGVESSGRRSVHTHDGGDERGTGPPADEQPQPDREHGLDEAECGQLRRGAALLDQHLALATPAHQQRDRGQGDDHPGQARGKDAHRGDALLGGEQPATGVHDDGRQPGREGDRVVPPVPDLFAEVGARVLQLVAQGIGGLEELREIRDPRGVGLGSHVPGHHRDLPDPARQGSIGVGVGDQQRHARCRRHQVARPDRQLVGQPAPETRWGPRARRRDRSRRRP